MTKRSVKTMLALLLAMVMTLQAGAFIILADDYAPQAGARLENTLEDYTPITELAQTLAESFDEIAPWSPETRNRVPMDENGNPVFRSEMEKDMWNLVVGHGQRFWGSPNEYNAARYVYDRLHEIDGLEGITHFIEGRGAAHGNTLSTGFNGRITFDDELAYILGNTLPNNDTFGVVEGAVMADFGTFPALVAPEGLTGNVVAVVRVLGAPNATNINNAINTLEEENEGLNVVGVVTGNMNTFTVAAIGGTATPARPYISVPSHFVTQAAQRAENFQLMDRIFRNTTNSVYATLPASTDNPDLIIVVSSHLDSVLPSPGAEDNASGTAIMMEMARRLSVIDRGNIEIIFLTSGGHEGGGMRGSVHIATGLVNAGNADIAINMNMDMPVGVGPRSNGVPIDAISMDTVAPNVASGNWNNIVYTLPAFLVVDDARAVWTPGQAGYNNVRIFPFGGSDHTQFNSRGIQAGSMINVDDPTNDLGIQYHNSRDNMDENYCFDRLNLVANLMENALQRAVRQQVTKQAQFYVDTENGIIALVNSAQIYRTFDRVEGTVTIDGTSVPFTFDAPNSVITFEGLEGEYAITGVIASGEGTWDHTNETRRNNPALQRLNRFQTGMRAVIVEEGPAIGLNIFRSVNIGGQQQHRMWAQINGANALMPYHGHEVTAIDHNGNDVTHLLRVNRIWNNQNYFNLIDLTNYAPWRTIDLTFSQFGHNVEYRLTNPHFFSFNIFNNGNSNNQSLANAGLIRLWTQLGGANALVPYEQLEVTATLPNGDDAMQFVRINNMHANPGNVNLIDVQKDQAWQTINLTAAVFGQTVEVALINDTYVAQIFSVRDFNNGNDNNASLANLGVIRIWTQLNGISSLVPHANLTVTALDQNGNDAMEFVRVNQIWNAPENVNLIDVRKAGADWQTIELTVILKNASATQEEQVVNLTLVNNLYVPQNFTLQAYNNGNDSVASIAGRTRIWTQINGQSSNILYENLTVEAVDQDGNNALHLININRIWNNTDYVNRIDVIKDGADWQIIELTVTLVDASATLPKQVVNLTLINNWFVEECEHVPGQRIPSEDGWQILCQICGEVIEYGDVRYTGTRPNELAALLNTYNRVFLATPGNLGIFGNAPFVIPTDTILIVENRLNVHGTLLIEGTVIVLEGGRINNQGNGSTITIAEGGVLINNGYVENVTGSNIIYAGTIINNDRFEVRAGVVLCSHSGTIIGNLNIHRNFIQYCAECNPCLHGIHTPITITDTEPTATEDGLLLIVCEICGEEIERTIRPALGIVVESITITAANVDLVVVQNPGSQNLHIFTITETIETLMSDGTRTTETATSTDEFMLGNNSRGIYNVLGYDVHIRVQGNTDVRELWIVNFTPRSLEH